MLPLQSQIVCEAESWVGTVEVPKGSNHGGRVDDLLKAYFGSTAAQPWCVVFAWVVFDRAVRALGGVNKLPNAAQVWGNARNTLERSKQNYRVDKIPAVGALFYRTSTSAMQGGGGDGSSGHFGVVVGVAPGVLTTIEGNQGSTDSVGRYTYAGTAYTPDGGSYGFSFIHVEETPVQALAPVSPCAPVPSGGMPPSGGNTPPVDLKQDGPSGVIPCPTMNPDGSPFNPCPPSYTFDAKLCKCVSTEFNPCPEGMTLDPVTRRCVPGTPPPPSTPTTPVPTKTPKECVIITLPRKLSTGEGSLPEAREITNNLEMAADIFDAHFDGDSERFLRARNGAAVRMKTDPTNRPLPTGASNVGVFKLPLARFPGQYRLLYVSLEGSPTMQAMWDNNLLAGSYGAKRRPIQITFPRFTGGQFRERLAQVLAGNASLLDVVEDPSGTTTFYNEKGDFFAGRHRSSKFSLNIYGIEIGKDSWSAVLGGLEQFPPGPQPIVIQFGGQAATIGSIAGDVLKAVDLAVNVVGPFIPANVKALINSELGEAVKIIKSVLLTLSQGGQLSIDVFLNASQQLVTMVAPDSDALRLVTKARDVYGPAATGNWGQVARELGINSLPVTKDVTAFLGAFSQSEIGRVVKDTVADFRARLSDLRNFHMFDDAQRFFSSEVAATSLLVARGIDGYITRLPVFQNILLNGAAGKPLALVPSVAKAMGAVLEVARDIPDLETAANFGLAGIGFGRPDVAFSSMSYAALQAQLQQGFEDARNAGGKLTTFIIPPSIPPEDRECYAVMLREQGNPGDFNTNQTQIIYTTDGGGGGGTVTGGGTTAVDRRDGSVTCPPSYTWNPVTRNCERTPNDFTPKGPDSPGGFVSIVCPPGYEVKNGTCVPIPTDFTPQDPQVPVIGIINPCAPGYVYDGRNCNPPTCPDGTTFVDGKCQPIEWETSKTDFGKLIIDKTRQDTGTVECREGFRWDASLQKCVDAQFFTPFFPDIPVPDVKKPDVKIPDIQCPPGYTLKNGVCVPPVIDCPPGYRFDGKNCIPPTDFDTVQCPPGYTLKNGVCTPPVIDCPPGYRFDGKNCVPPPPPPPDIPTTKCPPGFTFDGKNCVPPVVDCPPGYIYNGKECVPPTVAKTECPPGFTFDGKNCVPPVFDCPPGYVYNGKECVPPTVAKTECPPGFTFDGKNCVPPVFDCPPGYVYNGKECVPPTVAKVECPPGFTFDGKNCVPPPPPSIPVTQCPPGYTWNGMSCVPPPSIPVTQCPPGYTWNGMSCVPPPPPPGCPPPPPPYGYYPPPCNSCGRQGCQGECDGGCDPC